MNRAKSVFRQCYYWGSQICDPIRAWRGLRALGWYVSDYRSYRRMPGAEPLRVGDMLPVLHERSSTHELDVHYFYVNAWAMRYVTALRPDRHVDIASQTAFAGMLSAVVPVTHIDYRRLHVTLDQLTCEEGNILALPFANGTVPSLSCLHVAEHIGLGRYGDPIDPGGTRKAAVELSRVLAPGGHLFFAVPVGRPRVCFNAHRVHAAETIREYFADLELTGFSGVHDDGRYVKAASLSDFSSSDYACGMFAFRKPTS